MQILAGTMKPDTGEITWGQTVEMTSIPKDFSAEFNDNSLRIIDWLRQYAQKGSDDDAFLRGFLGRMLFSGDDVNKEVNVLSGGEKVRCMLSKVMLQKGNTLLLDDPTNHLDLESITSLNEAWWLSQAQSSSRPMTMSSFRQLPTTSLKYLIMALLIRLTRLTMNSSIIRTCRRSWLICMNNLRI